MALALRPGYRALLQAFGTTVAFGMLLQPAIAEEQVQKIQVTGSAIKRIAKESALPVQTVSSADIAKSGATSVTELMQRLPSMQGFTNDAVSVGGGGAGYSSASLHNLGDTRTLVLLNGRRVATFAGQTITGASSGVDLNIIPIAAIERVEVLTDGASSIYGTDAVAGVVNFILRQDFTGVEVTGGYYWPEAGGAEEKKASITAGYGNLDEDRFNVMLSYAHEERTPLKALQRPGFAYPKSGAYRFDAKDGRQYDLQTTSFNTVPANVYWYRGDTEEGYLNPGYQANGNCGKQHTVDNSTSVPGDSHYNPTCGFVYPSALEILPESVRDSTIGTFNFKINDTNTLFAEALYSQHTLTSRIAPPPIANIPIDPSSSMYTKYLAPYGVPSDADGILAYWRAYDAGQRTTEDKDEALHFAVGAKGTLFGWDYSTSILHSENKWNEYYRDGWMTNKGLTAAKTSGVVDFFVAPGNQSAAGMAALEAAKYKGLFKSGKTKLDMFQAQGSHELFDLPAGAVQLGTGFDIRRESIEYTPSAMAQGIVDGGIAGDLSKDKAFSNARNIWGVFAEVVAPLAKTLEASGSVRFDDYSDFGSTTNYKLSARWTPTNSLLFRTSFNTGFHAPQPAQALDIQQLYGVTSSKYACPTYLSPADAAYCNKGKQQYQTFVAGNPDLKPETSEQFTFGFRFEPVAWASVGADYWNVEIKDQFGQVSEGKIAQDWNASIAKGWLRNDLYKDPQSGQYYWAFVYPQQNLGDRKISGLDIDTRFGGKTPIGRFTSQLVATYIFSDKQQIEKGGEFYQQAGNYSEDLQAVTARIQGALINTLAMENFDHTFTINYKSGYDESRDGTSTGNGDVFDVETGAGAHVYRRVKEYVTLDWQTVWRPMKGLKLTGGIYNLTDANPPFSINTYGGQAVGYNPQLADPRGRTYYLQAGYTFK